MTDHEIKQRENALQYARTLLPKIQAQDIREISVAVQTERDGTAFVTIRTELAPGASTERITGAVPYAYHNGSPYDVREG